jgi:LacI family transcriptional regulator
MRDRAKAFSIKQLAVRAGLSKATVDRVLHARGNVRPQTLHRVEQALEELEAEGRAKVGAGRTYHVDVIMHTPARFSDAVQAAILAQCATFGPVRIVPRFHLFEGIQVGLLRDLMGNLREAGSHGVILKAADTPETNVAVNLLVAGGIPVITFTSDLPTSDRISYVGIDNRAAGCTAAYLLSNWLDLSPQDVGVVISGDLFRGEEERESGFRMWLRGKAPHLKVVDILGGEGTYHRTLSRMIDVLREHPQLGAIYSVGGGNQAIVDAFAAEERILKVLIGHDLDSENRKLLAEEKLSAVIEHNLQIDARNMLLRILQFHNVCGFRSVPPSEAQVVTPFNLT